MAEHVHLGLNPVRADRTEAFERFLSDVVEPAQRAQRPDLVGQWQVLRAREAANGVVTYAFMLTGGSLEEDWDLGVLLAAHHGEEEAERLLQEWVESFAPLDAWAESAVAEGAESNQVVWTMEQVRLG
jgi:hypothetical protein